MKNCFTVLSDENSSSFHFNMFCNCFLKINVRFLSFVGRQCKTSFFFFFKTRHQVHGLI